MPSNRPTITRCLWWALFCLCAGFYAYPYIHSRVIFGSWDFETLEFLHWDRQFNFSLAQTFKSFGPNILDPFDRTYPVFYQQLLYWIFGAVARWTGAHPWAAAHGMQLFVTPLLFVTMSALCGRLGLRGYPRLLALFLLFGAGPLSFFDQKGFGVHAVVLPFSHLLLGSYSDTYGVLFGMIGLYWLTRLLDNLESGASGRERLLASLAFGLSAAAASLVQLLCFVQFMALYGLVLVFWQFPAMDTRVRRWGWALLGLVGAILIGTRPNLVPMPVILGVGAAVFVGLFWHAKQRSPHGALALAGVSVVGYLGLNLWAVRQSGLNPFLYQDTVRTIDLGIPWYVVIWSLLPLIPGLMALPLLSPDLGWRRAIPWASLTAAILCCFNDAFGYNNHPYRFIPFSYPSLCVASVMGWQALTHRETPARLPTWIRPMLRWSFALFLAMAVRAQFLDLKVHLAQFSRPLDQSRQQLISLLEALRTKNTPHPTVYVAPSVEYVEQLAPYTGVRFFKSSFLSFGQRIRTENLDQKQDLSSLMTAIQSQRLPIDWVIVPRSQSEPEVPPPHSLSRPQAWAIPVSDPSLPLTTKMENL